ncbi:hypothetical protein V2A60_002254 [Cordyceps javanica]
MFVRWSSVEASGLAIEAALWMLTIHLVWSLQMRPKKRITIVAVFAFRLLIVPIIIFRLHYLNPSRNDDVNYSTIPAAILTAGALHFSIVATSLTTLKPFITVFRQPVLTYGSGSGGTAGRSDDPCDTYHKLELFRRVNRQQEVSGDSARWRPDQGSAQRPIVEEPSKAYTPKGRNLGADAGRPYHGHANRPPRRMNRAMSDGAAAPTHASERICIQKTTEVRVWYDDYMLN